MEESTFISNKLKKGLKQIQTRGLLRALQHYFKRWLQIISYYYIKEDGDSDIPPHLTVLPEGYELSVFNFEDVIAISKLEERKYYAPERYVIDSFNAGDTCLGMKKQDEIAAFAWFSSNECRDICYPFKMKENEAYLYDLYVLKSFRRKNLATILNYKRYEILKGSGRTNYYSIVERSNIPSFRLKQKMGGKVLFLGLCIVLFRKHKIRCVLKRY
jgi:ribosomal protein S18 acetylase RimI-like enzyme